MTRTTVIKTPTKKPKSEDHLRARRNVTYAKLMAYDEDEENGDDSIAITKEVKLKSMQPSNLRPWVDC